MTRKILCILQLPPPVHGAALMNQAFVTSTLIRDRFRLQVVDITTAREIEQIGHFSSGKITGSVKNLFKIIAAMLRHRPSLVYFTLSPAGFAFYRDAIYALLIRAMGGKLIFHMHGQGIAAGAAKSRVFRWLARRAFYNSHVIFLAPTLVRDLQGISYKKSFILPCGIPITAPGHLERRSGSGPVQLLYISNYVRTKGIIDLVDAMEKVAVYRRDFHLRLVGRPYDVSIEELNNHIRSRGLDDLITICGPRYNEEKLEELRRADLFVFPTYNDAFPLVLLEAMQWALPVITTKEGGIPDMIEDGVSGLLVNKRDISGLADKILSLLENPAKRISLGTAARERFMQKFTLFRFEQDMLQILDSIR